MRALLAGQRAPLVQMVKIAAAVAIAWAIGAHVLGHPLPYMAGIAAALTMQLTVYDSVRGGLQRAVGVVAGVVLVYFLGRLLGVHAWSVGVMVLVGLLGAWTLRLGPAVAAQVPITVMLVLAVGALVPGYAIERILDTGVGATVGVLVNILIVPPSYVEPARRALAEAATSIADLLRRIGEGLAGNGAPEPTAAWRIDAFALSTTVAAAAADVDRAQQSLRWNLLRPGSRPLLAREVIVLGLLDRSAGRTRGVVEDLAECLAEGALGDDAADALRELLEQAAASVAAVGASLDGGAPVVGAAGASLDGDEATTDAAPAEAALANVRAALERLRAAAPADDGKAWVAYGAVALDLRRIVEDALEAGRTEVSRRSAAGERPRDRANVADPN